MLAGIISIQAELGSHTALHDLYYLGFVCCLKRDFHSKTLATVDRRRALLDGAALQVGFSSINSGVTADDIPPERNRTPTPLREAIQEFERAAIDRALLANKGDLSKYIL